MYISYVVGVGGGCQNNNPFEAEKSSSMDKKDNYNTEAVEELISELEEVDASAGDSKDAHSQLLLLFQYINY